MLYMGSITSLSNLDKMEASVVSADTTAQAARPADGAREAGWAGRGRLILVSLIVGVIIAVLWSAKLADDDIGVNTANGILGHDTLTTDITGSLAGLIPTPSLGPYSAIKHALTALADVLRVELAASGVNVSLICPGVVRTRIAQSERNRPPEFPGASHADPGLAERYRQAVETSTTSPDRVAAAAVQAIRENRFLVLPSPETLPMLEEHLSERQASIRP